MLFEILDSYSGADKESSPKILRLRHPETNSLICPEFTVKIYQSAELNVPQDMCLRIFSHTKKHSCQENKKLKYVDLCLNTSSRCAK